jgi:PST family polysaccharide transporter
MHEGLRGQVVGSVGWVLTAQGAMRLVGLAATVVVARLLTPTEIGLAAEALVFSRLAFLLADVGLAAPLVQRREITDVDTSTVFWMCAAAGTAASLVLVVLAGPIAELYGEPSVGPMVAVLSASVFFTALGLAPAALLTRDMRFRSLELRSVAAASAAATTVIVGATLGYGSWAIIAQQLAGTGVSTVLLWLSITWRPRFMFSRASLRGFAGFSSYVFGSSLCSYVSRNADNFLVGRYLGAASLGAYSIAYNVMLVPLESVGGPVQGVLFPAMSKIREAARVGAIWIRATRSLAAFTIPAYLGLIVVAPDFVPVVFGDQWEEAIPVLQILAYVGLLQSLISGRVSVLLALDRASTLFHLTVASTVLAVVSFVVGLPWGLIGVATAFAVVSTGMTAYTIVVTGRATHVTPLRFLGGISGVLQAGSLMAVVVLAARLLLVEAGMPGGARLATLVAIGVAVYLPACAWRAPEVLADVREEWARRRSARAAAATRDPSMP